MSRHRIVRRMNYEDECYDDDDDYGQSYEDRYCISPSTAAEFTYNRERNFDLSSYMEDEIPEEGEMDMDSEQAQAAAPATAHRGLSDMDRGRLQNCLEEIHNVMGDGLGDSVLTEAVLRHNFNIQATLDELLSQTDAPKPQRTPRKKRERTQGDDADIEDLLSEISALDQQEHLFYKGREGRFRFQKGMSPPVGANTSSSPGVNRGTVRRVKLSTSSDGSLESVPGEDLPLSQVFKGSAISGNEGQHLGMGDSGSDSSSPLQFASPPKTSLTALTQQQNGGSGGLCFQGSEDTGSNTTSMHTKSNSFVPQTVLSSLKDESSKSSGQSLSDLIKAREDSVPEPPVQAPRNSNSSSQIGSLSLRDIIREHNSSGSHTPRQTSVNLSSSQKCEQKPSLSLSELIAQNKQLPFSLASLSSTVVSSSTSSLTSLASSLSTTSSHSSPVSSSPQASKGLSLMELISLRSSQQVVKVPAGAESNEGKTDGSSGRNKSSVTGLSLTQLINSQSQQKNTPNTQAASSNIPPSTQYGKPESVVAVSTSPSQCLGTASPAIVTERKESGGGTLSSGSGLSLSELIKQHQSKGSKQHTLSSANSASPRISADTTPSKDNSALADSFQHRLTLKPEENVGNVSGERGDSIKGALLKDTAMADGEEATLSLADCLKKKVILQPKHSKPESPASESDGMELDEEDYQTAPQKMVDFEADCFDPMKVDPALRKAPSLLAQCICLQVAGGYSRGKFVPKLAKRKALFPRFQFSYQIRKKKMRVEVPLKRVVPFDFKTPSPDDTVKARQRAVFTRSGQHVPQESVSDP